MVHWYEKEPAVGNVLLNVAPGAMEPEFHAPLRPVDVWAVLSLFVHVTVPPTATVSGLGEYAFVVRVDAPLTIDTGVPDAPGDGDGVGVGADGGEYDDPQAAEAPRSATAKTIRNFITLAS
jgi:hypothetical protein